MSILKYALLTVLIVLLLAMVLVGILSVTRGATVRTVITEATAARRIGGVRQNARTPKCRFAVFDRGRFDGADR